MFGDYTCILSRLVGEQGTVFSIEPIPETFEILSAVVARRQLSNVRLLNFGISESDGSAVMEIPLYEDGGENFYQAKIVHGAR